MKKVIISLLAIGALISCSKEPVIQEKPVDQDPVVTPAQMTQITFSANLGEMTKVSFDLSSGKVSWEEGDAISIFDGTNNVRALASEISEDGKSAKFKAEVLSTGTYYAVYPYSDAASFADAIVGTSGIAANEQDGSFASAHACAAVATSENPSFAFKNIVSLIAFSTERTDITCVEIVGADNEVLSGDGTIAFGADGQPAFTPASGEKNVVVNISGNAGTYYVGVNPVALTKGFTLNFYDKSVADENLIGVLPSSKALNIAPGKVVNLGTLDQHYNLSGKGTESEPWLIRCAYDLNLMRDKKVAQDTLTTEFYKVTRDIDMSAMTSWVPIDNRNSFYAINFDGQNHTISNFKLSGAVAYASIFGLICGTVKNIKLKDCEVATTSKTQTGILAAWVGNNSGSLGASYIDNVHAENCVVKNTAANAASTGIGIISGCVGAAHISNCSTDGCKVYRHSNSSNTDGNKESWTGSICGCSYSSSFENCTVTGGIVETKYNNRNTGGLVGKATNLSTGTTRSSFKNCSFEGSVSSESDLVGGLVAWIGGGVVENCAFKGQVRAAGAGCSSATTAYAYTGGVVGYVTSKVNLELTNCSFEGTCSASGKVIGAILGQNSADNATITGCSVKGDVNGGQFVGGVTGYVQTGNYTISDTSVEGNVTSSTTLAGGIIGQIQAGTTKVTNCHHTGDLKAATLYVGGIIANSNTATKADINRCSHSGNLTGTDFVGGIIGYAKAPGTVTNCYTVNGTLKGAQHGAGIASDCGPTLTVENCYSTLTVNAKYGMGCIVGRFCNLINPNTQGTWQTQYNNVLRGCIAWGAIESTLADGQTPATGYSSGAVLGCTVYKSTLSNCWRKPDMSFRAFPEETGYNTLFDQEDSSPASPYVKVGTETYYMPYHGKAASEGETISDVAARIGWDTTIWDLSGAEPKLK
ncbi:MAG: hypothetical protein MJY67_05965 [Bacteroidales bacterium]|nr:hypothetical protein [Bacteroidales bacterium]